MTLKKRLVSKKKRLIPTPQNKGEAGLSLLEVSVALMIMGVIAAGSVPLYLQHRAQQAHHLTQTHQEWIMMAVAQYVLAHQKLPCPALEEGEGEAQETCQTDEKWIGRVPFRTLNLPEKVSVDGHQRPWTYVVNSDLAHLHTNLAGGKPYDLMKDFFTCPTKTPLFFHDLAEQKIESVQDPLAVILISHPPLNQETPWRDVVHTPYHFSKADEPPVQVFWMTRSHLMSQYAHYSWHGHLVPEHPSTQQPAQQEEMPPLHPSIEEHNFLPPQPQEPFYEGEGDLMR